MLYESILQAKPGNDLAFAIRDGVPFAKLKDDSIAQVATTVVLFAKGVAQLEQEGKTASEQNKPETSSEASEPAPTTPTAPKKK